MQRSALSSGPAWRWLHRCAPRRHVPGLAASAVEQLSSGQFHHHCAVPAGGAVDILSCILATGD